MVNENPTINRCKGCKKWIQVKTFRSLRADGFCNVCFSANKIRAEAQKEPIKKDDDWDLGERQCNIDDDECESCQ